MADSRFSQAESLYRSLKTQLDAGQLTSEGFERALWDGMFEAEGRWWMLGANTGQWYASEGEGWVEREPPFDRADGSADRDRAATAPPASAPKAAAASDRTWAARVLRGLVLGAVTLFSLYSLRMGFVAWDRGDPGGGAIVMGFGLLLLGAIASGFRRRRRQRKTHAEL